jgi:hypothetical protein
MLLKSGTERPRVCISDLAFDQWEAGELDRERSDELAQHMAQCARCSSQRELLRAQAQAFISGPGRPEALPRLRPWLLRLDDHAPALRGGTDGDARRSRALRGLSVPTGLLAVAAAAAARCRAVAVLAARARAAQQ